jgi:chemotaxis protein methyltransferase CheR
VTDRECVEFLQWALPQLRLRWPGFRKVRRQVHKRIVRRLNELGLAQISEYREYLRANPDEWSVLDGFTRISISRFYRDRDVFDHLRDVLLPNVAGAVNDRGEKQIRIWSAGCASGEEPYSLAMIWTRCVQSQFRGLSLHLVATDADEHMLERARRASYPPSSIKDVPADWKDEFFQSSSDEYVVPQELRCHVGFRHQDIRAHVPSESFDIVLCRNLVFTYFDERVQRHVLERLADRLVSGGYLVIGKHEGLPSGTQGLLPCLQRLGVYRRV